jgi:hypothetical protein
VPALLLAAATIVAGPAAANPSRSGDGGGSIVVGGGGEPSLVVPLLVLVVLAAAVGATVWWWRHLGGWSPAEMTLALQATARDLDAMSGSIGSLGRESAAAQAHRRAVVLLPTVLRRSELGEVHAALAAARSALARTADA